MDVPTARAPRAVAWRGPAPFTASSQPPRPGRGRHWTGSRAWGAAATVAAQRCGRAAWSHGLSRAIRPGPDPAQARQAEEGVPAARLRNFCIIAHVDHGKSTLADRLLEATGGVAPRDMQAQCLDSLAVERERGITVKLAAARLSHAAAPGAAPHVLNLIDTPGHVDFSYEVSRSLAACEGCLLVVDASQGVQAQTLAHLRLARAAGLAVVPVLNKVDLPGADPEAAARELAELVPEVEPGRILRASAKLGTGIDAVLAAVIERIPPPAGSSDAPLRALVFDSYYDPYKGVVAQIRVVDGRLRTGDPIRFMNSRCEHQVAELGVLTPAPTPVPELRAGEVGYLAASIKTVADTRVGDTITLATCPASAPLPGYEEAKPMVFCGLFATASDQHEALREALGKLQLSDAALSFQAEVSPAMGHGFRCGFLGLLHMEIVQERLEKEHGLDLVTTAPTVVFKAKTTDGHEVLVDRPDKLPPPAARRAILEPYARVQVITPAEHVGPLMELLQSRRGEYLDMRYLAEGRAALEYDLPLAEVVTGLFDAVKSRSRGYASLDYALTGWREGDLVLLEMAINGEPAPPLACIVHRAAAAGTGRALARALKELIPRQQFRVPLQAMLGSRVIAAEAIPAARKDVLAKCYGGDISRKKKLLKKQAKGKKRMKMFGKVEVPQEAFMAVLQLSREGTG